jgi:hypothetical protein
MNRLARASITLIVLISSFALAQDSTLQKWQVYGGYSLLHQDTAKQRDLAVDLSLHDPNNAFTIKSYFNGWNAEVQYNASRWVGAVADFSGFSAVPFSPTNPSAAVGLPTQSRYSFLVGPVISFRNKTHFTPYAHVLFGLERAHLTGTSISGSAPPFTSVATTYTDFTAAAGAGVDYKVIRHFGLRLAQFEWYHTTLNANKFYGNAFNSVQFEGLPTHQRNYRISAGIIVTF